MTERMNVRSQRHRYIPSQATRLHRRQLFHWIGSDLVSEGKLTNEIRQRYVEYLRNSLKEGLWLKVPRKPDRLLDGKHFEVKQPICCFTETSLDEIQDHSRNYGRLGLGFPKRFVIEHGGRPVNYLLGQKNDASMQAWLQLAEILKKPSVLEALHKREKEDVLESMLFVSHFLKSMRLPVQKNPALQKRPKKTDVLQRPKAIREQHQRSFGGPLHYLEEREWRFVLRQIRNRIIPKHAKKNPTFESSGGAPWLVPYTAGKDLFTIVFPDNSTLAMAIDDVYIRGELFQRQRPHVTLLSLEDVGTF